MTVVGLLPFLEDLIMFWRVLAKTTNLDCLCFNRITERYIVCKEKEIPNNVIWDSQAYKEEAIINRFDRCLQGVPIQKEMMIRAEEQAAFEWEEDISFLYVTDRRCYVLVGGIVVGWENYSNDGSWQWFWNVDLMHFLKTY
jgi:hypothetical protein